MGTIQIDGSTPKITVGNATAEDATILFDGNAQDFYIALDDSADDLLIGKGSTVGTTPAIAIDENLKVNIPVTTASTSASTGSLTTGGGAGIGADLYVGDDVYLITDSAVLGFGADKDTLLTHTDGTGLTLNSTNKLCFNDVSQFVQGISATVLGLGATDEIDLTATTVDLNGTLNVSGVATFQAAPVFPDGSLALADLDIDGGTDIGEAIVDADLFIVDNGAGGTNRKTVASRLKTYIGSPITVADQWRLTTDFAFADGAANTNEQFITANLEQVDTAQQSTFGSAMTESSGVFTFPATGFYKVEYVCNVLLENDDTNFESRIFATINNSTYVKVSSGSVSIQRSSGNYALSAYSSVILDVTATASVKVKFGFKPDVGPDCSVIRSSSTYNITYFTFTRIGDT